MLCMTRVQSEKWILTQTCCRGFTHLSDVISCITARLRLLRYVCQVITRNLSNSTTRTTNIHRLTSVLLGPRKLQPYDAI